MRQNKRLLRKICRFAYLRRRLLLCVCAAAFALTAAAVTAFAADLGDYVKSLSLIDITSGETVEDGDSLELAANLELRCVLWNIAVESVGGNTKLFFVNPDTAARTEIQINDAYELQLPTYLQCTSFQPVDIKTGGITIATVSRKDDDTATLQFAGNLAAALSGIGVSEIDDISFHFGTMLDAATIGQRNEVTINLGGNRSITVEIAENTPQDAALTGKACSNPSGKPEFDPATGSFHWTVTVNPEIPRWNPTTQAAEYTGGYRFEDQLGNQHKYKDGSFRIQWGSATPVVGSGTLDTTTTPGVIEYTFAPDEYINDTVTITYDTEPADGLFYNGTTHQMVNPKNVTVNNTATLYKPGTAGEAINNKSGTAKYSGTDWLVKTSGVIDRLNKTIDWTLTVSTNGRGFEQIEVYDMLDAALTYDDGFSVKDGAGNAVALSANTGFTGKGTGQEEANRLCTITPVDKSTYTIGYRTHFTGTGLEHNDPVSVDNKAWLAFTWKTGHGPGPGQKYGIPTVDKPVSLGTSIVAKSGVYNPSDKRITWTVTVNANRLDIAGATITDTIDLTNQTGVLPTPVPAAVCTAWSGGAAAPDYTVTMTQRGTSGVYDVVLRKGGTGAVNALGTDTVLITYYTEATDPAFYANNATATFINTATVENITLANVPPQSLAGTFSATANPTGTSRVLDKDAVGYNFASNEITWKLTVNANNMSLTNATVTDVLPPYLRFVPGSATYSPAGSYAQPSVGSGNTLTFDLGGLSQQLTINFKVKLDVDADNLPGGFAFGKSNTADGTTQPLTVSNAASLSTDQYPSASVTEQDDIAISNKLLDKQGAQDSATRSVKYTIEINQNGADLRLSYPNGVFLTDELPESLFVDLEAVHLYEASVNASTGAFIRGAEVPLSYQQLQLVQPNNLQVTLPDPKGRYVLTYEAYINDTSGGSLTLTNKAGFGPDGKSGGKTISTPAIAGSGGSASLIPGKSALTIKKTDADDPTLALAGAVYGLYAPIPNSQNSYLFQTATTAIDANGDATATFIGLTPNRVYSLRELTAPAGYMLAAPIPVTAGAALTVVELSVQDVKRPAIDDTKVQIPETGDGSVPLLWAGLLLFSAAGLCVSRRRRSE